MRTQTKHTTLSAGLALGAAAAISGCRSGAPAELVDASSARLTRTQSCGTKDLGGGRIVTAGLTLQIFDVTNPAAPALAHKFVYGAATYGYSEAESNHKAFTYFPERSLLAFPYWSTGPSGMKSALEIFRVDAATGFARLGAIDHSALVKPLPSSYCGAYEPAVRRGIFLEDYAYAISFGGIVAKRVTDLAAAGITLPLPAASFYYPYTSGAPSCAPGI